MLTCSGVLRQLNNNPSAQFIFRNQSGRSAGSRSAAFFNTHERCGDDLIKVKPA
jgi:hypothetical protein